MTDYAGPERRDSGGVDANTLLVIEKTARRVKDEIINSLALYQTTAMCEQIHRDGFATTADCDSVDGRITELRGWLWGLLTAVVLSLLGTVTSLVVMVIQLVGK
jgi:hypothetical protein